MKRIESDGLGSVELPEEALYGIHSYRAMENFPISHRMIDDELIDSIVLIKKAAALVNKENGDLEKEKADAIVKACDEIMEGKHHDSFIVDAMQGGAGTSANMNANEVIANLAITFLKGKPGDYKLVHPIDDVNMHQSTNDVIPSAARLACIDKSDRLINNLNQLVGVLEEKADEYGDVIKVGRTQLQDAVPMKMSQSFLAYASMIERNIIKIRENMKHLYSLNLSATAIGTGINASEAYYDKMIGKLSELSQKDLSYFANLFDGTQNADDFVSLSSSIKTCALTLSKMASDLRFLSSAPNAGLNEINLPAMQSGSSIMPGKINPVIPEALNQAAFLTVGHDMTIALACEAGQLELNAFLPVIFFQLFEEIEILNNAVSVFTDRCVKGISVNRDVCAVDAGKCYSLATALNPLIGYDHATAIVKKAKAEKRSLFEIAEREYGLSREQLEELLDPLNQSGNPK